MGRRTAELWRFIWLGGRCEDAEDQAGSEARYGLMYHSVENIADSAAFRLRRGVNMEARDPKALPTLPSPDPEEPSDGDEEDDENGEDEEEEEADEDAADEEEGDVDDDDNDEEDDTTTPKGPLDPKDVSEFVAIKPRAIPNYAITDDSSVVVSSVQHEFQMSMAENHFSSTSFEIAMWVCDHILTNIHLHGADRAATLASELPSMAASRKKMKAARLVRRRHTVGHWWRHIGYVLL
jgi:hypothetical protein